MCGCLVDAMGILGAGLGSGDDMPPRMGGLGSSWCRCLVGLATLAQVAAMCDALLGGELPAGRGQGLVLLERCYGLPARDELGVGFVCMMLR